MLFMEAFNHLKLSRSKMNFKAPQAVNHHKILVSMLVLTLILPLILILLLLIRIMVGEMEITVVGMGIFEVMVEEVATSLNSFVKCV